MSAADARRVSDIGDVAAALLRRYLLDLAQEQEHREPDDRVQRRAQLMAHDGEEPRLGLAGDLRLAARLFQFDRPPVREVDRLFEQRRHGADAEIALVLHHCEAA